MISLKTVSQKLLSICIRFREPVVMAMVKYLFAVALVVLCIIEIECKTFHNHLLAIIIIMAHCSQIFVSVL